MATADGKVLVVLAVRNECSAFPRPLVRRAELLVTGMGKERAFGSVARALKRNRYRLVVSAGFAGGARAGFRVGELVAASEVVDLVSQRRFVPSSLAPVVHTQGRFLTVDRAVVDPGAKEDLGRRFQAEVLEMETSAVARAAQEAGAAWVGLRAILDPMEERLAVPSAAWAMRRLAVPSFWGELSRFLAAMRRAREELTGGVVQLLDDA